MIARLAGAAQAAADLHWRQRVGDPCEPRAHHGFNGLDSQVVAAIARWMLGG